MDKPPVTIEGREYCEERTLRTGWTHTSLARRLDDDRNVVIKRVRQENVIAPLSRSFRLRTAAALPAGVLPQYLNEECPRNIGDHVVLEYLPGLTIDHYRAAIMRMDPRAAAELLTGWIRASVVRVGRLMDIGLVHGDLKPSNITLSGLIDLDVLNSVEDHSRDSAYGSLYYMTPELLSSGKVSPSADLYALGVTVLKMFEKYTKMAAPRNVETAAYLKALGAEVTSETRLVQAGLSYPEDGRVEFMRLMRFVDETVKNDPAARVRTAEAAIQILDDRGNITEV